MATDAFLSEVRRLGGLEFTPQTPEAWAELAKILKRRAQSIDHARRIIDRFLEPGAERRCPTPGELAVVAMTVPADARLDRPDLADPCEACRDYGGYWALRPDGRIGRCFCERGRKLRAMDEARTEPCTDNPPKSRHEHPADADWMRRAAGDME